MRDGPPQWWAEFVATFGLLTTIAGAVRYTPQAAAYLVALYITAAYWFTASTSFANPAVTIARSLTSSFAGINLGRAAALHVHNVKIRNNLAGSLGSGIVVQPQDSYTELYVSDSIITGNDGTNSTSAGIEINPIGPVSINAFISRVA